MAYRLQSTSVHGWLVFGLALRRDDTDITGCWRNYRGQNLVEGLFELQNSLEKPKQVVSHIFTRRKARHLQNNNLENLNKYTKIVFVRHFYSLRARPEAERVSQSFSGNIRACASARPGPIYLFIYCTSLDYPPWQWLLLSSVTAHKRQVPCDALRILHLKNRTSMVCVCEFFLLGSPTHAAE